MAGGTSLQVTYRMALNWIFQNAPTALATTKESENKSFPPDGESTSFPQSLSSTGADANQMWRDRRFVTTSTGSDNLDLSGSLTNVFGETVTFATVRMILMHNRSTTAGDDLLVGGALTNALTTLMNGSGASQLTLRASGLLVLSAPLDGYGITAGSADTLLVEHSGSSEAITYDIVIVGTE